MKKFFLLLIAPAILIITSCGSSKARLNNEIKDLEKKLYAASSTSFDKPKADSLFAMYKNYIEKYPEDTLNARYTFNAASLAMNLEKGSEAVALFDQFINKYPDNPRTPVSMFFKGFIYENQLKDLDKAKEIYLAFLEKYPENDFADDARNSILNLGKSPEEMVAEFEKRKEDSLKNSAVRK